ncbi:MAG TPA: hypothetical protein VJ022_11620 [Anaerolineales bacterium]|nr:hypothetical protein [Anaerolineales bacterium]
MRQKKQKALTVRMERLPNRRAVERVREAYHQLSQAADSVEKEKAIQEAQHEPDFDRLKLPVSGDLCASINPATRAGSDD